MGNKFQFLIGILKTFCLVKNSIVLYLVSIPYRYPKNFAEQNDNATRVDGFNSL